MQKYENNKLRAKKIIHVITRMDMGGSAQNTLLTCLGLDKKKYEIILAHGRSLESAMTQLEKEIVDRQLNEAKKKGVTILSLDPMVRKIDPISDFKTLLTLLRLFKKEKPDIVHTHTSKAGILGRLAAWITRVPIIIHTPHGHVFWGHFRKIFSAIFFIIEKIMEPMTDRFIALTKGEKKDYLKLALTRKEKIKTIHSGVDVGRFMDIRINVLDKKSMFGIPPDAIVVGTVGWLLPIKGPMVLLKAMEGVWKHYPDIKLVYVGKGELEEGLKDKAAEMNVTDKVHFLGWREDIPELMQIMDIFVLPSLNEGMGRVLIEAMASSKPVIGSDVGGVPDLVVPGVNGLLVPPGNAQELSGAILKLIKDKALRKQMGQQGKRRVAQFDISNMIDKIDRLYEEMLMGSIEKQRSRY